MISIIWSVSLATLGIAGLWLAGSQRRVGWALGLAAQGAWIAYAITTSQYGFIASAIAYGFVYARNFRRARPRPITIRIHADATRYVEALRRINSSGRP